MITEQNSAPTCSASASQTPPLNTSDIAITEIPSIQRAVSPSTPSSTIFMPLTKTTSYGYQAKIIEATKDARYFGLFMEQGTGKTHVTIATMTHLYRAGKIDAVLILAPNGVHDNWARNELPLHCVFDEQDMLTAVWHGSDGRKARERWEYAANAGTEDGLIVLMANIEAVRTDAFVKSLGAFVRKRRFLLVVDESTAIKNPKAEQTKAVFRIAKNAAYARILTGTPITQSPLDLWAQCRVLDELALPYPSYTAFKREFAVEQVLNFGHRSFNKVVGYQNQDRLAGLIAPFTVRILKKDCLDLPPKVYQTRYVELTPEQKRLYRDLTKQCLAQLEPGMITVTTAITMMLRLHQITLGYVQLDDGTLQDIAHHRLDRLADLLEEGTGKTIIFVRFLEDSRRITQFLLEKKIDATFVHYDGGVTPEARHNAVNTFQNDPACQFFIATSAAAKGLTLTAAERVIYYSQGFSLETRLQSEDRAHRIGQKKTVVYTDLVASGTIDDKVVDALRKKTDLANSVLSRAALEQLIQLAE
jgi:SNF2 family DNA or RNA helicase